MISTAPVLSVDMVFIGSLDKNIYALDVDTGIKKWSFEAKGRIRIQRGLPSGGKKNRFIAFQILRIYITLFKYNYPYSA